MVSLLLFFFFPTAVFYFFLSGFSFPFLLVIHSSEQSRSIRRKRRKGKKNVFPVKYSQCSFGIEAYF